MLVWAPALSAGMISPLLLHSFQRGFTHRSVDGPGSALTPISVGTPTGGALSPQYIRHGYTHSLHAQLTHILCMMRRDGLPRCAVPTPLHKPLSSYSHSLTRPARRNSAALPGAYIDRRSLLSGYHCCFAVRGDSSEQVCGASRRRQRSLLRLSVRRSLPPSLLSLSFLLCLSLSRSHPLSLCG